MKKLSVFFILFIAQQFWAQIAAGKQTITVSNRSVDIITPANYSATQKYPVIFFLHGLGGDKNSLQSAAAVTAGQFIGVYPEGTSNPLLASQGINGKAWNSLTNIGPLIGNVDDVAFLVEVHHTVDHLLGASSDLNQYYSVGFSNGGSMNLKMVKNTDIFKAIVVGSMAEESGANGAIPTTATKVPMLFMFGMSDQVVPFGGGQGSYGPLANFEKIETTVKKWAQYNTGVSATYQQLYFPGNSAIQQYHFFEFRDEAAKKVPVYLYLLPNTPHDLTAATGFTQENIMATALRFFSKPNCYGFSRGACR